MYSTIEEISVGSTKQLFHGPCIDDDLLLFPEFGSVPVPEVPKRMGCLLVGLCPVSYTHLTLPTKA